MGEIQTYVHQSNGSVLETLIQPFLSIFFYKVTRKVGEGPVMWEYALQQQHPTLVRLDQLGTVNNVSTGYLKNDGFYYEAHLLNTFSLSTLLGEISCPLINWQC